MHISKTSKSFRVTNLQLSSTVNHNILMISQSVATFTRHQIERLVPVEALIKCKMQDNLEFLQWTKRFWDQYYPGGDYDALARRKGSGAPATSAPPAVAAARTSGAGAAARRGGTTPTTATSGTAAGRPPRAALGGPGASALSQENTQLKETVTGLERERDFYFSKLRDIELLVQQAIEHDPGLEADEDGLVKQIQAILYSTEVRVFLMSSILRESMLIQRLYRKALRFPLKRKGGRLRMIWRRSELL